MEYFLQKTAIAQPDIPKPMQINETTMDDKREREKVKLLAVPSLTLRESEAP